jgi:ATP-dependent exoDNAse (exonuclease V) alpha subunit
VSQHVTLGYALTIHSAQGSTVDTCYSVISHRTSASALYVAMTRGRHSSVAYVVTSMLHDLAPDHPAAREPVEDTRTPGQVLMAVMERGQPDLPATELHEALASASESMPVLLSR